MGGRPVGGEGFAQTMMRVDAPRPAPHLPYEDTLVELRMWYGSLSLRVVNFLRGLALWEELPASISAEGAARTLCTTRSTGGRSSGTRDCISA
ncbi:NACHT N-terminal helical domain 7-containing protein [Streptomyces chartreusis]|uniref:NACHT N-terminal helical domain 7-containing protein n=1 Tax=Streptomyces chartreusis TaxID=1969 RepID=UPI0036CC8936